MGVKQKSSEYQRCFRTGHPALAALHEQNVNYRAQRRYKEHNHNIGAFDWDPETDSELGVADRKPTRKQLNIPKHIYQHEKFNRNYHDRLKQLTQDFEQNVSLKSPAGQADGGHGTPLSARSRDSGVQTDTVVQVDKAVNGSVETYPRQGSVSTPQPSPQQQLAAPGLQHTLASRTKVPTKPSIKKPTPSKHVPKPQAFSAPLGRPMRKETPEGKQAPFVLYGCKDDEPYLGTQKTYNVRASADVYPSALLAQKRRRAQIELREKLAKSAPQSQKRKAALFNDFNERVKRETSAWDTEYRSHYAGYERGVYQRALSARPVSRQHDPQLMLATW